MRDDAPQTTKTTWTYTTVYVVKPTSNKLRSVLSLYMLWHTVHYQKVFKVQANKKMELLGAPCLASAELKLATRLTTRVCDLVLEELLERSIELRSMISYWSSLGYWRYAMVRAPHDMWWGGCRSAKATLSELQLVLLWNVRDMGDVRGALEACALGSCALPPPVLVAALDSAERSLRRLLRGGAPVALPIENSAVMHENPRYLATRAARVLVFLNPGELRRCFYVSVWRDRVPGPLRSRSPEILFCFAGIGCLALFVTVWKRRASLLGVADEDWRAKLLKFERKTAKLYREHVSVPVLNLCNELTHFRRKSTVEIFNENDARVLHETKDEARVHLRTLLEAQQQQEELMARIPTYPSRGSSSACVDPTVVLGTQEIDNAVKSLDTLTITPWHETVVRRPLRATTTSRQTQLVPEMILLQVTLLRIAIYNCLRIIDKLATGVNFNLECLAIAPVALALRLSSLALRRIVGEAAGYHRALSRSEERLLRFALRDLERVLNTHDTTPEHEHPMVGEALGWYILLCRELEELLRHSGAVRVGSFENDLHDLCDLSLSVKKRRAAVLSLWATCPRPLGGQRNVKARGGRHWCSMM